MLHIVTCFLKQRVVALVIFDVHVLFVICYFVICMLTNYCLKMACPLNGCVTISYSLPYSVVKGLKEIPNVSTCLVQATCSHLYLFSHFSHLYCKIKWKLMIIELLFYPIVYVTVTKKELECGEYFIWKCLKRNKQDHFFLLHPIFTRMFYTFILVSFSFAQNYFTNIERPKK